jgi:hypothetical protein
MSLPLTLVWSLMAVQHFRDGRSDSRSDERGQFVLSLSQGAAGFRGHGSPDFFSDRAADSAFKYVFQRHSDLPFPFRRLGVVVGKRFERACRRPGYIYIHAP